MPNLIERVADRHEKKAKIDTIDGKFKRVSPIIGTWLETVISKLSSLENVMGYAEKIATKEHKRLEDLVKKKYGSTDNLDDDAYEDPLVQAFFWVDEFWGQVSSGRYKELNKFQKKIEEARYELEQTIYDVNGWRNYATRMASYVPSSEVAKTTLLKLFGERHADYGHHGYTFITEMPRMGWDKVKAQLPKLLKDWKQGRPYEDQYEAELMFDNSNSWIKILWNKKNNKITITTDDK